MKKKSAAPAAPTAEKPAPPPLPKKSSTTRELSYTVPHILKSLTIDDAGFKHPDLRQGMIRQLDFETEIEYVDTPADERDQVFAIRATNQINFADHVINVINDKIALRGFRLVPTSPTASEYLAKVGTRVMVSFDCRAHRPFSEQQGKPIYQISRIFVVLP